MKSKFLNYFLSLTFLLIGFSISSYNQTDNHGGQNLINKQKLDFLENETKNKETTNDYQKILNKLKHNNKKAILFFVDINCDWSDKFYETIKDNDVNNFLKDNNYLKYYVNIDKDYEIFKKYNILSTPSYVIIDENEKVIKKGSGYKPKIEFLWWIKNIVKKSNLKLNK